MYIARFAVKSYGGATWMSQFRASPTSGVHHGGTYASRAESGGCRCILSLHPARANPIATIAEDKRIGGQLTLRCRRRCVISAGKGSLRGAAATAASARAAAATRPLAA